MSERREVTFVYPLVPLQPPVYLCGTFTTPAWLPLKMRVVSTDAASSISGERPNSHKFEYCMNLEPGIWEYKFRVGDAKWAHDEGAPTIIHKDGTINNVLIISSDNTVRGISHSIPVNHDGFSTCPELETKDQVDCFGPSDSVIVEDVPEVSHAARSRSGTSESWALIAEPDLGALKRHHRSISDIQCSKDSFEIVEKSHAKDELQRRGSATDIERLSYIMALPSKYGHEDFSNIMACQGSRIFNLSPDYTSAEPLLSDDCGRSEGLLLPHEQYHSLNSTPDMGSSSILSLAQRSISIPGARRAAALDTTSERIENVDGKMIPNCQESISQRSDQEQPDFEAAQKDLDSHVDRVPLSEVRHLKARIVDRSTSQSEGDVLTHDLRANQLDLSSGSFYYGSDDRSTALSHLRSTRGRNTLFTYIWYYILGLWSEVVRKAKN